MNSETGLLPRLNSLKEASSILRLKISREACERSLAEFVRQAWHVIEPGQPYVHGWHIDAICEHLEAVTDGRINRLLINVPPGCMKSLLLNVLWPAWEWTRSPHLRYVATAHSQSLAIRDSTKMRRLVASDWYKRRWPAVELTGDQNAKTKFENTLSGFREAVAFESMTGVRGDRVLIDDPHSVDSAGSDAMRETTIQTFLEAVPTRLNNPATSAIVVIMQRLHQNDVSGVILDKGLGYVHLCLPMEYDPLRQCMTEIGFVDPRDEDGELLFPERFPAEVVERDKSIMGPYAVAGQFQQTPTPRGGGILKRDWWQLYDDDAAVELGSAPGSFPQMDLIVASLDTAYTSRQENDYSALTVWGLFHDRAGCPKLMLMAGWQKRLELHGQEVERYPGEDDYSYEQRARESYGLVEQVAATCRRFKVDVLLIESTAAGLPVEQELRRLHRQSGWSIRMISPKGDKVARAYMAQSAFADGLIYAPDRKWSDEVITCCEHFPRGKHDDLVDSVTMAIRWFKDSNLLVRAQDVQADFVERALHTSPQRFIYDL